MSISREQIAARRRATASAAKAVVEDLHHIREVLRRRSTSKGEIRRLSAVIRRLLVDGDIQNVASSRVGKLLIESRDCKPYYELGKHGRVMFFASGGAPVFGVDLGPVLFFNAGKATAPPPALNDVSVEQKRITMRLDNFLAQKVLCMNDKWISRRAAIKHVANYGSGVHSKTPDTDDEKIIALMRNCATYTVDGGKVKMHILPHLGADSFPGEFTVDPPWEVPFPVDVLDPVLLEVLAAGLLIANSPGVLELEDIITAEP